MISPLGVRARGWRVRFFPARVMVFGLCFLAGRCAGGGRNGTIKRLIYVFFVLHFKVFRGILRIGVIGKR